MRIEPLAIEGAWVCTPKVHPDMRGSFLEWFRGDLFTEATGRSFDVVQANHSVSHRGVVRGVHFADVPPGQAKYVYCPTGVAIDVVVDIRVDSPTYGLVDTVRLDQADRRGVFVGEGLGHAFVALEDDTAICYLLTNTYQPAAEHAVNPLDPTLAIPWHDHIDAPLISDRDAAAPMLDAAERDGLLPDYAACVARYAEAARR